MHIPIKCRGFAFQKELWNESMSKQPQDGGNAYITSKILALGSWRTAWWKYTNCCCDISCAGLLVCRDLFLDWCQIFSLTIPCLNTLIATCLAQEIYSFFIKSITLGGQNHKSVLISVIVGKLGNRNTTPLIFVQLPCSIYFTNLTGFLVCLKSSRDLLHIFVLLPNLSKKTKKCFQSIFRLLVVQIKICSDQIKGLKLCGQNTLGLI